MGFLCQLDCSFLPQGKFSSESDPALLVSDVGCLSVSLGHEGSRTTLLRGSWYSNKSGAMQGGHSGWCEQPQHSMSGSRGKVPITSEGCAGASAAPWQVVPLWVGRHAAFWGLKRIIRAS